MTSSRPPHAIPHATGALTWRGCSQGCATNDSETNRTCLPAERLAHSGTLCRTQLSVAGVLVSACVFLAAAKCAAQGAFSAQDILRAWHDRQAHISSAKFTWVQNRVDKKGSLSRFVDGADPFPADDTSYSSTQKIYFTETQRRYEYEGMLWDLDKRMLKPVTRVRILNNGKLTYFQGDLEASSGSGFLDKGTSLMVQSETQALPLMWFLRPFDRQMGSFFSGEEITIVPPEGFAESAGLLHVCPGGRLAPAMSFWLDPDRGFSIVRAQIGLMQLEVNYTKDDHHGWVPSTWHHVRTEPEAGVEQLAQNCRVSEYQINVAFGEDTFNYRFPAGTEVLDPRGSVLMADHSGELHPKGAVFQGRQWSRHVLVAINLGVVIVLVGAVAYIYNRRRRCR